MDSFELDVGGGVTHKQSGAKSVVGVASDQSTVYYDPLKLDEARQIIENQVRLHNFHKELKSGMIPARVFQDDPLKTASPFKKAE